MTNKEILEGNKLIAEFMGFPYKTVVTVYNYGMDYTHSYDEEIIYSNLKPKLKQHYKGKNLYGVVEIFNNYFDPDNQSENFEYKSWLHYGNSWNELMPVVEKIESLGVSTDIHYYAGIKLQEFSINHGTTFLGYTMDYDRTSNNKTKIEVIYNSVVKFIKWYNKQDFKND